MAAFSQNLVVRTGKKGNRSPYRAQIYASLQSPGQMIARIEAGEFPPGRITGGAKGACTGTRGMDVMRVPKTNVRKAF